MRKLLDLTGQRFGKYLVLSRGDDYIPPSGGRGQPRWLCRCDCGRSRLVLGASLRHGKSKSCCGAGHPEALITHGRSRTPVYAIWHAMKRRCSSPKDVKFALYGGRGIRVCDRWLHDFAAFLSDMGERPSARHSIDRIDGRGNYEPGNCRWATFSEQSRNTTQNRYITAFGETKTVAEWVESSGIPTNTLWARIRRGWPHDRAVSEPVATP